MNQNDNSLPVWAGLTAFFTTVLAIGAINILNPDDQIRFLSGIIVGIVTGATIYTRQKMDDARMARLNQAGIINITQQGDKKVFTLELTGDPEDLEHEQDVVFHVRGHK